MVRVTAFALLALSAVASARPLRSEPVARRELHHEEIVARLISRDLADSVVLPMLTVRDLDRIISEVSRRTTTAEKCAAIAAGGSTPAASSTPVASSTPPASTAAASTSTGTASTGSFKELAYPDFQISGGVAGKADQEAAAVLSAFDGVDLATVSSADLASVQTMREAAESAETDDFNPQIAAASGTQATQLQTGKTKNKVLKLTLEVFVINAKIAQQKAAGQDTSANEASLAAETTKLNNNIATDKANAGNASLPATL